jgi:hypothetical protein
VAHAAPTVSFQESMPEALSVSSGGDLPAIALATAGNPPPRPNFPVPVLAESSKTGSILPGGEARESIVISRTDGHSRGGEIIYDIFIRTYPGDYNWLAYCLKSIHKFATGFRKIWIVSPAETPFAPFFDPEFVEWKVLNEESEDGYLSQQIHKLYADAITGYEADYYLHIDSDTLFTRPVTPQDFFSRQGGMIWYYTPYENTETPWQPITEKFIGHGVPNEFMRRLPMMVPRWLYAKLREYCFFQHKRIISEYIRTQPYREFSEFNALGACAWQYHHDKFHWVNTLEGEMPAPFARQFFSWDGITDEVKKEIQEILSGAAHAGQTNSESLPTVSERIPDGGYPIPPAHPLSGTVEHEAGGQRLTVPTQKVLSEKFLDKDGGAFPNGEWTSGDHIRWLADYIKEKPNRRQYVLKQLAKARLLPLRKGRPHKKPC